LSIQGLAVPDLKGLSGVSEVGNALSIGWNSFVSLDGLQNLTRVGGVVTIDGNEKLETLYGLGQVEDIGTLKISGNPALKSLSGLARLAHLGGGGAPVADGALWVWQGALTEVGLPALRVVDGNIDIVGAALESLAGLESLTNVRGRLFIQGAEQLKSLDGLNNLASIDEIMVWDCPKLVNLRALSSLESVANGCSFVNDRKLPTCEAQWLRGLAEGLGFTVSASDTDNQGACL